MTLRLAAAALAVGLVLVFLLRAVAPQTAASPSERRAFDARGSDAAQSRAADAGSFRAEVDRLPPPPARNIFRYADSPAAARGAASARGPAVSETTEPVRAEPPPPALRLVGFVRRPEGLRAAIATASGVVIVAPGDLVLDHAILGVDEDRGLRLRAPDGSEQTLVPPS